MATLKLRILDWLFTKIFGEMDIDAEIFTSETDILIVNLTVRTKFGPFSFPILHKRIPSPGTGFILDAVEAANSVEAGIIDHVGGILPAPSSSDEGAADADEDTRPA